MIIIYLDNSATTCPDPRVLEAFVRVNREYWGNPSSIHNFGGKAEVLLNKSRYQIARLLGVKESEVIFTSGGTEGNNIAIKGIATFYNNRGKHIITSAIEHPSVLSPFTQLSENGYLVTVLPVDKNGLISLTDLCNALRPDTILVSIMHVNNEIGTIFPIKEIGKIVKARKKAFFHVDAIQSYGKVSLDLRGANVDLCTLSAHKFHGLKGCGILIVREKILLDSIVSGGNQERKIRSGTINVAGAVSTAYAMNIASDKFTNSLDALKECHSYFLKELQNISGIEINSPLANCAPHILNFSVPHVNAEVFVRMLEEKDIMVSTTSACSSKNKEVSKVVKSIGKSDKIAGSAIRISMDYSITKDEIDYVIKVIKESLKRLMEKKFYGNN